MINGFKECASIPLTPFKRVLTTSGKKRRRRRRTRERRGGGGAGRVVDGNGL